MTNFEQGLLKAAKVVLYHAGAIFLVGISVYVAHQSTIPAWFGSALTGFGIPVAVVNAVWAGIEQAVQNVPPAGKPQ